MILLSRHICFMTCSHIRASSQNNRNRAQDVRQGYFLNGQTEKTHIFTVDMFLLNGRGEETICISNIISSCQSVIRKTLPGWNIGYNGHNVVKNGGYGQWFASGSKNLDKACSVYGNQGLELDCPIVLFGGGYIRKNGQWVTSGASYDRLKRKFQDPETIVENNFRVLLTRARKEMILLIPNDLILDETYQYFIDMGMDQL